jgi:hypothetical protein
MASLRVICRKELLERRYAQNGDSRYPLRGQFARKYTLANEEAKYHLSDSTDLRSTRSRASVSVNMFTMCTRTSTGNRRIGGGSPTARVHRNDDISSSNRSSYRLRERCPLISGKSTEAVDRRCGCSKQLGVCEGVHSVCASQMSTTNLSSQSFVRAEQRTSWAESTLGAPGHCTGSKTNRDNCVEARGRATQRRNMTGGSEPRSGKTCFVP